MPSLNYAQTWNKDLLEILIQGTLTSPFVTSNVRWGNNSSPRGH